MTSPLSHLLAFVLATLVADKDDERGATAVEYALVVGLVSIVVVAAVVLFNDKITTFVNGVSFG